jgi:DNA-binding CsgD family transcriptional regulator
MDKINISDEDLAANKQGTLSQRQQKHLYRQRQVWVAGSAAIAMILLGLTAVLLLKLLNPAFADSGQLFILLPLALFWLWLLRKNPAQWQNTNRDLRQGKVADITAPVHTDFEMGIGIFRSVRYYIQAGGQRFRVSREQFHWFRNGEAYRVYFSPHSGTFLGALAVVQERKAATAVPTAPSPLLDPLTDRETEILQLIAAGLSNKEIADQLSLSTNTVKMYASQLYQKLDVNRRTEAVARALEIGLLEA